MHKTIDLLAILDIHKNLVPNCGMWASSLAIQIMVAVRHSLLQGSDGKNCSL
jgi:hypothetical protein